MHTFLSPVVCAMPVTYFIGDKIVKQGRMLEVVLQSTERKK